MIEAVSGGRAGDAAARAARAGAPRCRSSARPAGRPKRARPPSRARAARVGRKYDWLGLVGARRTTSASTAPSWRSTLRRARGAGGSSARSSSRPTWRAWGRWCSIRGRATPASALEPRFARRLPEARGVAYAAEVAPGLYRGGQPDADGIAWLKSIGVKTVINLRHYPRRHREAAGRGRRPALRAHRPRIERRARARAGGALPDPRARPGAAPHVRPLQARRRPHRRDDGRLPHGGGGLVQRRGVRRDGVLRAHRIWRDLRKFVKTYRPLALGRGTASR